MNQNVPPEDIKRWKANLQAEINGASLYSALADAEPNSQRADVFRQLAEVEVRHQEHWAEKLREAGVDPEKVSPGLQAKILSLLARVFGVRAVLPVVRAMEVQGGGMYTGQADAGRFVVDERTHARVISQLAQSNGRVEGMRDEPWHRTGGGGSLRAAVFGLNDGLVSNLSLVMGVAGANPSPSLILLAGIAGLLAGAFSMGSGEYISVRSQRELFERQISQEQEELRANPEEEQEELSLIYQAKGIDKEQAEKIAAQLTKDESIALDTLAREELGLDPSELGSPWGAALSSFTLFAAGAIVPVLPYVLGITGVTAIVISAILSALALSGFGAALSILTGRSPLYSGGRMLFIGAAAATATFLIGKLIGVSVS